MSTSFLILKMLQEDIPLCSVHEFFQLLLIHQSLKFLLPFHFHFVIHSYSVCLINMLIHVSFLISYLWNKSFQFEPILTVKFYEYACLAYVLTLFPGSGEGPVLPSCGHVCGTPLSVCTHYCALLDLQSYLHLKNFNKQLFINSAI